MVAWQGESLGYIVGISEHCGPALTWKILTADMQKVIFRSRVRPCSSEDSNVRADLFGGEEDPIPTSDPIIKSRHISANGETKQATTPHLDRTPPDPPDSSPTPIFNPEDLVGRTFLLDSTRGWPASLS